MLKKMVFFSIAITTVNYDYVTPPVICKHGVLSRIMRCTNALYIFVYQPIIRYVFNGNFKIRKFVLIRVLIFFFSTYRRENVIRESLRS